MRAQYEDVATRSLMMLPTDMALRTDPDFFVYAKMYADDQGTACTHALKVQTLRLP